MEDINYSKNYLLGGAIACSQADGGFQEGGKGISTQDLRYLDPSWTPEQIEEKHQNNPFSQEEFNRALKDQGTKYYPLRRGIDFYHHYKEDIKMLAEMVIAAFLTSALVAVILGGKVAQKGETKSSSPQSMTFSTPAAGIVIPLEDVADSVFANKSMGEGFAVKPSKGSIYAPVSGKVTMLAETKHGIGITTNNGLEVLIHLGIDTVELNGNPFKLFIKKGDEVASGQKIAFMDIKQVKDSGKDPTVIVVITNSKDKVKNVKYTLPNKSAADFDEIMSVQL